MRNKGILWLALHDQSPAIVPMYPVLARHFHVTLHFGCSAEEFAQFIGREVRVQFDAECWDGDIQACSVRILDPEISAICQNENPHVTISMGEKIRPVQSNDMLRSSEHSCTDLGFTLPATVEFVLLN